jgi:hypothetical protein
MHAVLPRTAALLAVLSMSVSLSSPAIPADGEPAEKRWAFRSPVRPAVPAVKNSGWVRNPIDAFILARLEAAGLTPAPEADRATLLRRVTFDLTGLPPTPAEIEAAQNDRSEEWYEKVVERLLASPRHGERWATFWLDLVRYAETDGFNADGPRPTAWHYRDYVIRAFNSDKPYDRFIREQLAGDELYPDDPDALMATGYCRHYPDEWNAVNLEQRRQEILNDITDTTGSVFLGLTLGCARCHNHKFDPITQEDYYRIQAFFAAFAPAEAPLATPQEMERYRQQMEAWQEQTAELRQKMAALEEPLRKQFAEKRKSRFPKEYQEAFDTPPQKRTPLQKQIAGMVEKQMLMTPEDLFKAMKPDVRKQRDELSRQMDQCLPSRPAPLATAPALTDVGTMAPATFLLRRGDWRNKGPEVVPGFLSAIEDRQATIPPSRSGTTGRRSVLAQWLTRSDHPLTARVMVNRLWQHHFGRGIVASPSDFGVKGDPPTHPELLDWLACEFVKPTTASGGRKAPAWSLKHMHRLMVTSSAYRQAVVQNPDAAKIDPGNHLLWRMNRRRLEGEALRDAMLSVSGRLNEKQGGPSVFPELPSELGTVSGWKVSADPAERDRRSVYVFVKRNLRYPMFAAFDAPDASESCARRERTTNAPQALQLLHSKIVLDLARSFAGRVLQETGGDTDKGIDAAYRLALARTPTDAERTTLRAFLDRQSAQLAPRLKSDRPPLLPVPVPKGMDPARAAAVVDLCHVVMNLNEFMYVD